MKFRQDTKIISKRVLIIIVSSLILNFIAIDVNAQISWQRDLVFGKFTSTGAGHITISGDNNSTVTTDGGVLALTGITPQSANLHVFFNGNSWYTSVTITYDAHETFTNGSSTLTFSPSPKNGAYYRNPKKQKDYTLDFYLGGTLTINGTGMIGGTYTDATIMVYCTYSNQ
jgi:hypothetical protein